MTQAEVENIARKTAEQMVDKLPCREHVELINRHERILGNGLIDTVREIKDEVKRLRAFIWAGIITGGLAFLGILFDIITHLL